MSLPARAMPRNAMPVLTSAATTRWWEYATEGRIFCGPRPEGHHIPNTFDVPESGFIRCNHWIANEQRECGLWVFTFVIRGGRAIVARVTLDEKKAMRALVTPAQMIDFLGIFSR